MPHDLVPAATPRPLTRAGLDAFPALFADAGEPAVRRLAEFFTAEIRNKNTRAAYAKAVSRFSAWCQGKSYALAKLTPVEIAAYVEELGRSQEEGGAGLSKPSVKQHLAAIRMLFDYLVTGQVIASNPATSVRGPKYVVRKGKTVVLQGQEAQALFAAIEADITRKQAYNAKAAAQGRRHRRPITGELRDRALLALMVYSFARVGAAVGMNVEDYCQGPGRTMLFRLHEKGGKHHEVPAHHQAEAYLDAYLHEPGIAEQRKAPLFRALTRSGQLTPKRLDRRDVWAMIKRRAKAAGLPGRCTAHSFRATGITVYLSNGGTLEHAQAIAAHASPRTTKLYDRTDDQVTLDEINRIDLTKPPLRPVVR
jgi:site-specific recombinase XerD